MILAHASGMVVGTLRIELGLPGVRSLKQKRAIVQRVRDRVAARFNVAVAEVGALDAHGRAELGLAVVSNEARHASAMLEELRRALGSAAQGDARVDSVRTELLHPRGGVGADREGVSESWGSFISEGDDG